MTTNNNNQIKIELTQAPYIINGGMYQASAVEVNTLVDADERETYLVQWDIKDWDDGIEPDDESDMCDWDKYTVYNTGGEIIDAVIIESKMVDEYGADLTKNNRLAEIFISQNIYPQK